MNKENDSFENHPKTKSRDRWDEHLLSIIRGKYIQCGQTGNSISINLQAKETDFSIQNNKEEPFRNVTFNGYSSTCHEYFNVSFIIHFEERKPAEGTEDTLGYFYLLNQGKPTLVLVLRDKNNLQDEIERGYFEAKSLEGDLIVEFGYYLASVQKYSDDELIGVGGIKEIPVEMVWVRLAV